MRRHTLDEHVVLLHKSAELAELLVIKYAAVGTDFASKLRLFEEISWSEARIILHKEGFAAREQVEERCLAAA